LEDQQFAPAPAWLVTLIGCSFLIIVLLLVYSLATVWPAELPANPAQTATSTQQASTPAQHDWDKNVWWFGYHATIAHELRLLLIVIISAGLGSYIHAATSFTSFVGNRQLQASWLWWYVLRGPIGVALAFIFYSVVRGGLLSSGALGTDVSPFGVAAMSSLVGMFSKQATDKLRETADNLFRVAPGEGDDARANKLQPENPAIIGIVPANVPQGAGDVTIRVQGKNFLNGDVVLVNGAARRTDFVSDSELVAHLEASDTASACALTVVVKGEPPSTRQSGSTTVTVRAVS